MGPACRHQGPPKSIPVPKNSNPLCGADYLLYQLYLTTGVLGGQITRYFGYHSCASSEHPLGRAVLPPDVMEATDSVRASFAATKQALELQLVAAPAFATRADAQAWLPEVDDHVAELRRLQASLGW